MIKKIFKSVTVLLLTLAVSSCSSKSTSDIPVNTSTAAKSDNVQEYEIIEEDDVFIAEEEDEVAAESDPRFTYYKILSEEYKENYHSLPKDIKNNLIFIDNSKIMFVCGSDTLVADLYYTYDTNTQTMTHFFTRSEIPDFYSEGKATSKYVNYYKNRHYFKAVNSEDFFIQSCNLDGKNIVKVSANDLGIPSEATCEEVKGFSNGCFLIQYYYNNETYYKIYNFLTKELWDGPVMVSNDTGKSAYITDFKCLKGTLFVESTNRKYYTYNKQNEQWEEYAATPFWEYNIGEFNIGEEKIYSYMDGEEIATLNRLYDAGAFYNSYYGGNHNVFQFNDHWYKIQIPSDGSDVDYSQYEPLGEEKSSSVFPVNGTYYLYLDEKRGLFLRSYEKGSSQDIDTIYSFE